MTASAGNHGRALAYAADALGMSADRVHRLGCAAHEDRRDRAAGAELRLCATYDEAERQAEVARSRDRRASTFPPTRTPTSSPERDTILLEVLEDLPALDAVVAPVGGGGLISGIGIAAKALAPSTGVIGVEVAASCRSRRAWRRVTSLKSTCDPSLADGLTGNLDPDTITFDIVDPSSTTSKWSRKRSFGRPWRAS